MPVNDKPLLHKDWIHPHALRIVELLQNRKFMTYLVGGCVRDLLAGVPPKDFDIATSARPQQVKRTVPSAYIIGRRFRLVLVKDNEDQFEVATFRRSPTIEEEADENLEGDNLFGSPEEDARRRDFTMNGLFYDPVGDRVIDYVNGIEDVESRIIRMIGEPEKRLLEDPIRIFRALRLAHKLSFSIEPTLRDAMYKHSDKMILSVLPRRREEILKILRLDDPMLCLTEAYDLGVLKTCFPTLHQVFENPESLASFHLHLQRMKTLLGSPSAPADVFLILIFAYVRACVQSDPDQSLSSKDLLENDQIKRFMRDELGMFNLEQSMISSAFLLQTSLKEVRDFEKRGRRRRNSLLSNDAFPMALVIATADFLLSPADFQSWNRMIAEDKTPELLPNTGPS